MGFTSYIFGKKKVSSLPELEATTVQTVNFGTKFGLSMRFASMAFSNDFKYLFVSCQGDPVYKFNVVNINDLNTWTLAESWLPLGADNRGIGINADGTKIYVGRATVEQYTLSTPYLLSSAVLDFQFTTGIGTFFSGLEFSPNQMKVFINDYFTTELGEYNLLAPGDLQGATLVSSIGEAGEYMKGVSFYKNGTRYANVYGNKIQVVKLNTAYSLTGGHTKNIATGYVYGNTTPIKIVESLNTMFVFDFAGIAYRRTITKIT